jgi:hypothetical protein
MPEIKIERISGDSSKSVYKVQIVEDKSTSTHTVEVANDYYNKITGGKITPDDLVIKSFKFLLQREPKEMIMSKFDLPTINRYFPEYESRVMEE